jgi:hypothetical protein
LERLAYFAQSVMTNMGAADLVQRVQSPARGSARNPPTDVEKIALAFSRTPSHRAAADVLVEISKQGGVRTHRPAVFRKRCSGHTSGGGSAGRHRRRSSREASSGRFGPSPRQEFVELPGGPAVDELI